MDELHHLLDRIVALQQHGEDAVTAHELDRPIEYHTAKMEALRLKREALILEAPQMLLMVVSGSETQLHQLWLQVQQLVIYFALLLLYFLARCCFFLSGKCDICFNYVTLQHISDICFNSFFMVALCNRADHYIFILFLLSFFFLLSSSSFFFLA